MADRSNEGSFRHSGRYGYATRNGLKVIEVQAVEWALEIGTEEIPIPGDGETSSKDAGLARSGSLTIQQIDSSFGRELWGQVVARTLPERRRARDQGLRVSRGFDLQVWLDDPDALGAEVWELRGVKLGRLPGGFNGSESVINREFPFTYDEERPIRTYEMVRGQVDPATGLPQIRYIDGRPT